MSYDYGGGEDPRGDGDDGTTAGDTYDVFQRGWSVVGPTVMLIYIIPVFLINIVLWAILLLIALPRSLLRVRFVPVLLIAMGTGLLLIQANQDAIVEVLDVMTACVDQLYAYFGKAMFDDVVITFYPVCTLFSYFISVVKYTVRGVTNEYRCYFSCDIDYCECTTCGGVQCTCDECGLLTCNAPCDDGDIGCPTAGGFAAFLGDCCICFIVAFRQALVLAGVPLPEAIQLVEDLINFLDIAPSTNPVLFDTFVANFPQPGDVDWLYSQTLKREIYDDMLKKNIPLVSMMTTGAHQKNIVRTFSSRKYAELGDNRLKRVMLERYINMSAEGHPHEVISRQIPDVILEILCAGKTPGVDCPEPDPTTGYNYPIFELIANQFFGPFIELFSEIVLWLFNFLAVFFDLGYDQFLQFLDDVIHGTFTPDDALLLVVQGFQLFTQEFLCQLAGWSFGIVGINDFAACCATLDFSGPVELLQSILTLPDCFFQWDSAIFNCFRSLADFVDCAGGTIPLTRDVTLGKRSQHIYQGGHGTSGFESSAHSMSDGGSGYAPSMAVKRSRSVETRGISKYKERNTTKTPEEREETKRINAIRIHRNPILRGIHEKMIGMSMEEAYPNLGHEFAKTTERFKNPIIKDTAGAWDKRMDDVFGRGRRQTLMHKLVDQVNVLKMFRTYSTGVVSRTIDVFGEILFDVAESYVSQVGVGEPSHFSKKAFDIETIRRNRRRALAMRGKRSTFDHQLHLDFLDEQERLYWQENTQQIADGDPSDWSRMTHGQKALRHTAQWASTLKTMVGYATWDDASYDFITPSTEDLMTEIDQRALGGSIVRSVSHWMQFIKQDNAKKERDTGKTMDDRPAFVMQIETVLKTMTYRFIIPAGLPDLRDDLCERGPRWCQTAHRIIDPSIRGYELDQIEKRERIKAREQGDMSVPFQLTDITFGTVMAWMLEHLSYRANEVAHRQELSEAIFQGNETKYVELKMMHRDLKHPLNSKRSSDETHQSNMRMRFSREFTRLKQKEERYGHNGTASWFGWWTGEYKDRRLKRGGGVDPELIRFFGDHNARITRAAINGDIFAEYKRTAQRLPQLAVVGTVLLPLLKNIRYVFGVAVPILSSPYAQNVYGFYIDFLNSFLGDIIHEPIADLVNSPGFLLDFGQEFSITTLESINYLATEITRTLMCLAPQIVLQTVLYFLSSFAILIPYIGTVLSTLIGFFNTIGTFFLPLVAVCPAEVIVGEQNALTFLFDALDCDPSIECLTSLDCPGQAPCRCPIPRVTQWLSLFWKIDPDTDCTGGDIGHCLCFWQGPCDQAAPELTINKPFDDTCDKFGYATGEDLVPWYPGNKGIFSSLGNFWSYVKDYLKSGFVWVQFISKTIARGWEPFFSRSTFIAIAGIVVGLAIAGIAVGLTVQRVFFIFFTIVVLIGVAYGGPAYTDFVADHLIPALQRVGDKIGFLSSITGFLLDFFQFGNATDIDPIGSPDPSEFTCFMLNSGTGLMAIGITSFILLLLLTLLSLGILADLLQVILYFLLIVPRTIWRLYEFVVYEYNDGDDTKGYEGGYGGDGYGRDFYRDPESARDIIYEDMMAGSKSVGNISMRNMPRAFIASSKRVATKINNYPGAHWKDWRIGAPLMGKRYLDGYIPTIMKRGVGLDDILNSVRNTADKRGWETAGRNIRGIERLIGVETGARHETRKNVEARRNRLKTHLS